MASRQYAALAAMAITLSCCTTARLVAPESWQQHSQQVQSLHKWRLQGRISLQDSSQTVQANIDWREDGDTGVLRVYGSFGLGSHELHYDPQQAELRAADGTTHNATSIPELMQARLGWSTPQMFNYWTRGLPGPDSKPDDTIIDPQGRLAQLHQEGWHIEYLDYGNYDGIYLPAKIRMRHEAPATIVMAIHKWELAP